MFSEFSRFIADKSNIDSDINYHYQLYTTYLSSRFRSEINRYFDIFDFSVEKDFVALFEKFCVEQNYQILTKDLHKNKNRFSSGGISFSFLEKNSTKFTKIVSVQYSISFKDEIFLFLDVSFQNELINFQIVYVKEFQTETAHKICSFLESFRKEKTAKQTIYSLILEKDELVFSELGGINHFFISENYTPEIANSFSFLQTELSKPNLQNKFALLSGPPGSGKTHFVRALISSLPNTAIINLDQSVASNFSSSQILSALLKFKQENDFSSILFLIEDADYLILTRSLDNMGPLSSLLNASDGILGDIFNLRILATTNAKKIEIEKALLRPGRLLKHVEFGLLSAQQANQILVRLADAKNIALNNFSFCEPQSLASVYQKIYDLEISKQC